MTAEHPAAVRPSTCSCCSRRGARYMVRLDPDGREVTAVCPACDTRVADEPGWTESHEDDPRG